MGTLRGTDAYDGNYSLRLVSSPVNIPDYNLYDTVYANFTSSLNGFVKSHSSMGNVHFLNAIGNELRVDKLELFNQVALPEEAENINEISIYPNPCKDDLNLIFNNNKPENLNYSIYDIRGKRIKSDVVRETKISTRELSSGFYILELTNNGYSVREKFIVK